LSLAVASFDPPLTEDVKDYEGDVAPGKRRFYLHLGIVPEEKDTLFARDVYETTWKKIDAQEASKLGYAVNAEPVWVFPSKKEGAACKMRPGQRWAWRGGDGAIFTEIVQELEGDCEGDAERGVHVAAQGKELGGCRWRPNPGVTARKPAAVFPSEGLKPAAKPPSGYVSPGRLPKELRDALDPGRCKKPKCDLQWSIGGDFEAGDVRVYQVLASQIYPTTPEDECNWRVDDQFHVLAGWKGQALVPLEAEYGGYMGMVVGAQGPVGLVVHDLGTVRVYAPPRDGVQARKVQEFEWYWPHDEERISPSFGPYCGP
jgi:hypothetical protein